MNETEYRGASPEAIRHHYDLSNDFFELWLDETRSYSCALFDPTEPDEPLADAQRRKLDYLAAQARADGAAAVLDVGCGWGGMMSRLVDHHGVSAAVGLTLSDAQAASVRERADQRIEVRVENWANHRPIQPYDAIVSIGAFEHFADYGMPRSDRVASYRRFFPPAAGWLVPGGRLALQTVTKGNNLSLTREWVRDMQFIIDHIFPESELPWLAEVFEASQGIFDLVVARNDPDDYAGTCATWRRNLLARRSEAEALVGPATFADYDRYLRAASEAFTKRHLGLVRLTFERVPS